MIRNKTLVWIMIILYLAKAQMIKFPHRIVDIEQDGNCLYTSTATKYFRHFSEKDMDLQTVVMLVKKEFLQFLQNILDKPRRKRWEQDLITNTAMKQAVESNALNEYNFNELPEDQLFASYVDDLAKPRSHGDADLFSVFLLRKKNIKLTVTDGDMRVTNKYNAHGMMKNIDGYKKLYLRRKHCHGDVYHFDLIDQDIFSENERPKKNEKEKSERKEWPCDKCTFLNKSEDAKCLICGLGERPKNVIQQQPPAKNNNHWFNRSEKSNNHWSNRIFRKL